MFESDLHIYLIGNVGGIVEKMHFEDGFQACADGGGDAKVGDALPGFIESLEGDGIDAERGRQRPSTCMFRVGNPMVLPRPAPVRMGA